MTYVYDVIMKLAAFMYYDICTLAPEDAQNSEKTVMLT